MIDTVELVWGGRFGTAARRADAPQSGRRREVVADPIRLNVMDLGRRLGTDDGQVRIQLFGDRTWTGGHWRIGDAITLMYRTGRVELRASLPKLLVGRNDVVLTDCGVHEALRELVAQASDAIAHPLSLREAVPRRLDYTYQWDVPSVTAVLEHLKTALNVPRKRRTLNVDPRGGASLVFGYGSRSWGIRFYDKVGEMAAAGIADPVVELDVETKWIVPETHARERDRLLRYEVQEKRGPRLRLIHERGYTAGDVRAELARPLTPLGEIRTRDLAGLIGEHGIAGAFAAAFVAEHGDEALAALRVRGAHRNTVSAWRRRGRIVEQALRGWHPVIPRTAFVAADVGLWADDEVEAA